MVNLGNINNVYDEVSSVCPHLIYSYREPMFRVTVSVAVFIENRVAMFHKDIDGNSMYGFPTSIVKAGGESIQFAALKRVREDTGIILNKESLIPVDFRNVPVESMNVIDIGMTCMVDKISLDSAMQMVPKSSHVNWYDVDFENKLVKRGNEEYISSDEYYYDHNIFISRAIDVVLMVK